MGDRCYMSITCRRADVPVFEEIGFYFEYQKDEHNNEDAPLVDCVRMIDEEADYAHNDDMPSDLVYYGSHEAGDNYPSMSFACDGETLQEHVDADSAYPVRFDDEGNPEPKDLEDVKAYILFVAKVQKMLEEPDPRVAEDGEQAAA